MCRLPVESRHQERRPDHRRYQQASEGIRRSQRHRVCRLPRCPRRQAERLFEAAERRRLPPQPRHLLHHGRSGAESDKRGGEFKLIPNGRLGFNSAGDRCTK